MNYGLVLPNLEPRTLSDLAADAEASGWDGVFVWDTILGFDAWVSLAAVAMRTERVRIGTLLTPLSRRRPWTVAAEAVTLDHLSGGRLILPIGLGATGPEHQHDEFRLVGEERDRRVRAQRLDEGLAILAGLWSGEPFSYRGEHYRLQDATLQVRPVQPHGVPIWVVGAWPRPKSMRRVVRCDGVLPVKMNADRSSTEMTPADIEAMRTWVAERRTRPGLFDIVIEGDTPGDNAERAAAILQPLAEAGVTWWLESVWKHGDTGGVEAMRTRIRQGPPGAQMR